MRRPEQISHVVDNFFLLSRAAACGLGVALSIDVIVRPYLEEAQLVLPFEQWCKLSKGDYVVCRRVDWSHRPTRTLRKWLMPRRVPTSHEV